MQRLGSNPTQFSTSAAFSVPSGIYERLTRHVLASAIIVVLLAPLGAAALMQGRAASKAIVLDGQENFRSFRTASSEAGR